MPNERLLRRFRENICWISKMTVKVTFNRPQIGEKKRLKYQTQTTQNYTAAHTNPHGQLSVWQEERLKNKSCSNERNNNTSPLCLHSLDFHVQINNKHCRHFLVDPLKAEKQWWILKTTEQRRESQGRKLGDRKTASLGKDFASVHSARLITTPKPKH